MKLLLQECNKAACGDDESTPGSSGCLINGCASGHLSNPQTATSIMSPTSKTAAEEGVHSLSSCSTVHQADLQSNYSSCPILPKQISMQVEYPENVVDIIIRRVNDSKFAPAIPEELQLDHVLSSTPYQSMLESLFGGLTTAALDVPLVTKAYEESYMREAGPGEPSCAMGELCECMFIDKNMPFVGVQFKLPVGSQDTTKGSEIRTDDCKGIKSPCDVTPGMCVLCCRKTTQRLFYDICYSGNRVQGLIQQYGNLCNQPGEYARCCMLVCPPNSPWQCMPRPIMSHQRNRYRVHVVAGLKHLQQLRVSFEDFVTPSDMMQA